MAICQNCGRGEVEHYPLGEARTAISNALFALNTARQAADRMKRADLAGRILTIIKDEVEPIEDELRVR